MVNPSFVPPADIRRLRDYTRLRQDLTADRTRHKQRLEKLLEDALLTELLGRCSVSGRRRAVGVVTVRPPTTRAGLDFANRRSNRQDPWRLLSV
jgi:hypothetical protein